MDFASLWIGSNLSKVEQTSMLSYVYNKHSYILFVYDMNLEVPDGVIKKDAKTIIPESEIFKVDNSFSAFSDIFRFKMIKEFDLVWTDTDSICLSPNWNFKEYIFGYEDVGKVGSSVLKMPKDSELIDYLINASSSYDKTKIVWSEIGPDLVTKGVDRFSLNGYAQPVNTFFPVHYSDWNRLWDPSQLRLVLDQCKNSHTVQIWNQFLNRNSIDKNSLPKGSAMYYFYNKFKKNKAGV